MSNALLVSGSGIAYAVHCLSIKGTNGHDGDGTNLRRVITPESGAIAE